jgi:hypothetical protein
LATNNVGTGWRDIPERFLMLADAHHVSLPETVELMRTFRFTLLAVGSTECLLDLLTIHALCRS